MFRKFLQTQVDSPKNQVLVIGENHDTGSAHHALASEIKNINNKNNKKIIFLTEYLHRLQTIEGNDIPYELVSLRKAIENESLTNQKLFMFLLSNGIEIYGVESKKTAPTTYFVSTDKKSLYQEVEKEYPYLLEVKEKKEQMDYYLLHKDIDFETFSQLFASIYGSTPERIIIPNKEFSEQAIKIIQKEKNALCILGVGSAHVPRATKLGDKKTLDEGIHAKLTEALMDKKTDVTSCFVSYAASTCDGGTYTPANDEICSYGVISPCFKIPLSCSFVDDQKYISKIESRLSELRKTSKWVLYNPWSSQSVELQLLTDIQNLYQVQEKLNQSQDTLSLKQIVDIVQKKYVNEYHKKVSSQMKGLLNEINPLGISHSKHEKKPNKKES